MPETMRPLVRSEFTGFQNAIAPSLFKQGAESVRARLNIKCLAPLVIAIEEERSRATPWLDFLGAGVVVAANYLRATIRNSLPRDQQRAGAGLIVSYLNDLVAEGIDDPSAPTFIADFDPVAGARPNAQAKEG